jgi:hypothetical protein
VFPRGRELKKVPVAAAMFATRSANEPASQAFWEEVAVGGLEDDVNSAIMLDNWLLAYDAGKLQPGIGTADFYRASIFCWNNYRAGKQIDRVRFDFKSWPKVST